MLLEWLVEVHYKFFMSNKRFWYEKRLQEADKNFCVLASNLRRKENGGI